MESISERTQRCLSLIKSKNGTNAKVILLVGKLHAGKSSIAERITGVLGLSNNGTRPGPQDLNKWEVFCEIASTVQDLRHHAIFGVWYVVDNSRGQDNLDTTLVAWLDAFCGDTFCPSLTFVTTFWRGRELELQDLNNRFEGRIREWNELRSHGAQHHEFGKRYMNGTVQNETISWYDATTQDELALQAKEMVRCYCHGASMPVPQILQELESMPLENTRAAQALYPNGRDRNQFGNEDIPRTSSPESEGEPNAGPQAPAG